MSIDLTSKLNISNYNAVDSQKIAEVTKEIFTNAQNKTTSTQKLSEQFDLSKFKRVDLGLEVYGRQISAEKATQIAVRQAGLDIQINQSTLSNVQYLNTQAALRANQDLSNNVSGKIHTQISSKEVDSAREVFSLPKSGNIFDVASLKKDKTGSNASLYYGQKNPNQSGETKENTQILSIFA